MSTLSTKQLRNNMAQVIKDLQRGRSIKLSYRRRVVGVISPIGQSAKATRRGSPAAISQFLASKPFGHIPRKLSQSQKSIKQEIAELRDQDLRNDML